MREWAYGAVRRYWLPNGYDAWANAVQAACGSANAFGLEQGGPLPPNGSRPRPRHCPLGLAALQPRRIQRRAGASRPRGKVSKGGAGQRDSGRAAELLPEVLRLKGLGYSNRDIAEDLGIGSAGVSRYLSKISPE